MRKTAYGVAMTMAFSACGAVPTREPAPPKAAMAPVSTAGAPGDRAKPEAADVTQPHARRRFSRGYPRFAIPPRSGMDEVTPVDWSALPIAHDSSVGTVGAAFTLHRVDLTPSCRRGDYAEHLGSWAIDLSTALPLVIRIGGTTLPPSEFLDGNHDTDEILGTLMKGQVVAATWSALSPMRSRDHVDVTVFDGSFDPRTGRGAAQSKSSVRAMAVSDDVLYAYRKCVSRCDEPVGSPERDDEISLVGPPAVWIGSTAEPAAQHLNRRTPFTRLSAPIHPGSSATLSLTSFDDDIARFKGSFASAPFGPSVGDPQWTTFSLEAVWPAESPTPNVNLFVGHAKGDALVLRPDVGSLYDEPSALHPSPCRARR